MFPENTPSNGILWWLQCPSVSDLFPFQGPNKIQRSSRFGSQSWTSRSVSAWSMCRGSCKLSSSMHISLFWEKSWTSLFPPLYVTREVAWTTNVPALFVYNLFLVCWGNVYQMYNRVVELVLAELVMTSDFLDLLFSGLISMATNVRNTDCTLCRVLKWAEDCSNIDYWCHGISDGLLNLRKVRSDPAFGGSAPVLEAPQTQSTRFP